MKHRSMIAGIAALVAALALFGMNLGTATPQVGAQVSTTSTVASTPTVCGGQQLTALQAAGTCTPASVVRTATPRASATAAATNTPQPSATMAPASTMTPAPPAPAATSPTGGRLGAVTGPNTGSGGGAGAANSRWLTVVALALAVAGISSIGYSLRRR
ncbi:MAG: hypothetical protein IVW36_05845 [Dehalococcoidia bacterium]|nr:hypothetical protein [Dehalococcoidia bacterium]